MDVHVDQIAFGNVLSVSVVASTAYKWDLGGGGGKTNLMEANHIFSHPRIDSKILFMY